MSGEVPSIEREDRPDPEDRVNPQKKVIVCANEHEEPQSVQEIIAWTRLPEDEVRKVLDKLEEQGEVYKIGEAYALTDKGRRDIGPEPEDPDMKYDWDLHTLKVEAIKIPARIKEAYAQLRKAEHEIDNLQGLMERLETHLYTDVLEETEDDGPKYRTEAKAKSELSRRLADNEEYQGWKQSLEDHKREKKRLEHETKVLTKTHYGVQAATQIEQLRRYQEHDRSRLWNVLNSMVADGLITEEVAHEYGRERGERQ